MHPLLGDRAGRWRAGAARACVVLALLAAGHGAAAGECATTTWVVRHAEKAAADRDSDVVLSAAGRARAEALAARFAEAPPDAVYATHLRRTQQTVAPVARAHDLDVRVLPADAIDALVARLRTRHCGESVLVAAHSNTIPVILAGLGVIDPAPVGEDEYGVIYVVQREAGVASVGEERFGAQAGP